MYGELFEVMLAARKVNIFPNLESDHPQIYYSLVIKLAVSHCFVTKVLQFKFISSLKKGSQKQMAINIVRIIEYEIFGEGSHISTNQKRESTVFSPLIG